MKMKSASQCTEKYHFKSNRSKNCFHETESMTFHDDDIIVEEKALFMSLQEDAHAS